MQIYVNYMHVFLFFIITDKMRPFGAFKLFDIVVETFNIILNQKTAQFSFISYVFYCFANFLCISLFLRLMYFIVFLYGIVSVLNITKYNSDFNCNESKYCILELKMEFWHKKPFSIRFVHKSRKLSNFEPTFDYIMLRNLRTVRPIFPKIVPKVAQDLKEKSNESLWRGKIFPQNYRAKLRGGGRIPPPPPRSF